MQWRPMSNADLSKSLMLASTVQLPGNCMDETAFKNRYSLGGPNFCFVLVEDKYLYGYVLAHPWLRDDAPKLNAVLAPPGQLQTLFVQGIGIAQRYQGRGYAAQIVEVIKERSRRFGYRSISLVAVSGTLPYWESHGFEPVGIAADNLRTYGAGAAYMVWEA